MKNAARFYFWSILPLQLAMQAVKAREEYAHPYFWAPFVVMGDWR